ncbi:ABC transporter ATP-binding protein/permease [Candidatus Saccharibacteria bacterium]|nr:ABC transporter ATP-binding protein/permease [Candidatus Saccharibacteria bacterium]
MLELKNITKVYQTGSFKQKALDNVSLTFRDNEFASVLGPSGSGKTTLLNIIGGLDSYTKGDLIIDGISTKEFKDSDWDAYRNHRIGFVFQSYNLISHQTVLNNVRLALTLSGISKKEGSIRARAALKAVGLGDHMMKRPAELSGGQMQRVAIARALVNDPDILLADEPTGALDSETSEQIMKILKKISKTRLVVMVTHNPELAREYSTRIIRLKDGQITSDSHVHNGKMFRISAEDEKKKSKKTHMSFRTALSLSFNNLLTKKARTILVSIAGSIGIIGIALILAVSTGFQNYVDSIEKDVLVSYPLMITEESFSMANLMAVGIQGRQSSENSSGEEKGKDAVEVPLLSDTLRSVATNDLKRFKQYYEEHKSELENDVKSLTVGYGIQPTVYTIDATGTLAKLNPLDTFTNMFSGSNDIIANFTGSSMSLYLPLTNDMETLESQYKVLSGRWPEAYDEVIVNLGSEGSISDFFAYGLGLKDTSELDSLVAKLMAGESSDIEHDPIKLDYQDFLNLDLRVIIPSDLYRYNEKYSVYEDMSSDEEFLKKIYDEKSIKLKVVGVITAKEGITAQALDQGVNYNPELIKEIIKRASESTVVKEQIRDDDIDVFSGAKFDQQEGKLNYKFSDLITVDQTKLMQAMMGQGNMDDAFSLNFTEDELTRVISAISSNTERDQKSNLQALGYQDLDEPSSLWFYFSSFDGKENFKNFIEKYNSEHEKDQEITYSDMTGLLMDSVRTIVDAVSYVLIAFVSISLVVSSFMIGIITYISVYERKKEIGILRAIGASKHNVSSIFNAETFIIGLLAGLFGIGISYGFIPIINTILAHAAEGVDIRAALDPISALLLVGLSIVLTLIGGLIPARSASHHDPVEALRSE